MENRRIFASHQIEFKIFSPFDLMLVKSWNEKPFVGFFPRLLKLSLFSNLWNRKNANLSYMKTEESSSVHYAFWWKFDALSIPWCGGWDWERSIFINSITPSSIHYRAFCIIRYNDGLQIADELFCNLKLLLQFKLRRIKDFNRNSNFLSKVFFPSHGEIYFSSSLHHFSLK